MSLWTCVIDDDCDGAGRVCLVDSVTERPLPLPLFRDTDAAEDFEVFAALAGYEDVRGLGRDKLDQLHTAWLAALEADSHLGTKEARHG